MSGFAHDTIVPDVHSTESKKKQVGGMFDSIAHRYDFLNRFLSLGIDIAWRKKAIDTLRDIHPKRILDVATGTADVAIQTVKQLQPEQIIGIDISEGMLAFGREKIQKKGLAAIIQLETGDSEAMRFESDSFDAVTVAFGVRNFQNLRMGLSEIHRVLRPGGKLVVLEFSKPTAPVIRSFYAFYMRILAPALGRLFSKNKTAYSYLDESIRSFPEGNNFVTVLEETGFTNTSFKRLTFGICTIYCGIK
ncbi:MAG: bifunctional demethylmenaquinone methyltransferase/2-methoxy-6-polyprenyl-1,4-benzoquinol methylase UbiE [Ferruginibacter sp.]